MRRLRHVPDVDAEADDLRVLREDGFEDVDGALVDVEFEDRRAVAEAAAEVGEQVAQAEGGVGVFGVEGGEDDVGHDGVGGL